MRYEIFLGMILFCDNCCHFFGMKKIDENVLYLLRTFFKKIFIPQNIIFVKIVFFTKLQKVLRIQGVKLRSFENISLDQ
jgi:hypothetical protein